MSDTPLLVDHPLDIARATQQLSDPLLLVDHLLDSFAVVAVHGGSIQGWRLA
jgi:hypothetical protein